MEYLNNGPLKIPVLGFGTFLSHDEKILSDVLHEALKQGYRHIDTAANYGNEHVIGKVLKEWISSGKVRREELFITTKLKTLDLYADKVEDALKTSLEKLQLDYVDLYLIHFPVALKVVDGKTTHQPTDLIAVWKKMEEQVDAGRTKTIGVSNFSISQIERIKKIARIQPVNLQIEVNLYYQNRKLIEYAQKNNLTVVAYSPLGNPGRVHKIAGWSNVFEDKVVQKIAQKHSKSIAQIVIRFLIQKGIVTLVKCSSENRLKENKNVFDFKLDQADVKALEGLDIGPKAKTAVMALAPGIEDNPEFPFKDY